MFDGYLRPIIDPPLNRLGHYLARRNVSSNQITLLGVFFALIACFFVTIGWFFAVLVFLILNRLCDGLDGAVARATKKTDFGGFLDIVCDFIFYGFYPLAFILYDAEHALAYGFLVGCFVLTGVSFLAYATIAAKRNISTEQRGKKSFYYVGGLAEGTETIITFMLMALIPSQAYIFAYIFGVICLVTVVARIYQAKEVFT